MSQQIRSIRGMHDMLPEQTAAMQFLEGAFRQVMDAYGYREIRVPILEKTELFKRSIGEVTDIVEKEMYTFDDRNGDSLTLRPEGTAGCVRAGIEHGLIGNQAQRWWYAGPMFRYERPQKGRYRQFHQAGVEVFGLSGPDIDAELLFLSARLWRALGLTDAVRLEINSLGSPEARAVYVEALTAYFRAHHEQLDEDSRRRLDSNPMRILDSKNPDLQALIEAAPRLNEYLDEDSRAHFAELCAMLDARGIEYRINPRLVRGLDYYTRTVFEWVTDRLGAQGAVCAGGRYDGLIDQLGGKPTPGIGFAMGLERLLALLAELQVDTGSADPQVYVVAGQGLDSAAMALAERLRDALPRLRLMAHCGGGSFKSQMKKADRSGAAFAVLLGEQEHAEGRATIKPLRSEAQQQTLDQADLAAWLQQQLAV